MLNDVVNVLTDPAHWIGHVVMDGALTLILAYPIRLLVARHDRRVHGKHKKAK